MPSFGQLTLIVLAGLCGPLLSSSRKVLIPVAVGELVAGIALGKTGADATAIAVVMLVASFLIIFAVNRLQRWAQTRIPAH